MPKSVIEAGIDIGSSQVVVIVGSRDEETGHVTVLGAGKSPCRGIKGGVVVNIPEARGAIERAVSEAEETSGQTIEKLLVGVRGAHIETFNHRGAINISRTDKEITAEDLEHVITNAKAIQLSADREILHTVPQDFSVDKQSGVMVPVGMEGSHLAVDVHIAVASSSHISNIVKAINLAGFEYSDLVYGAFAVGDCVVSEEEKDLGAALIDLGGQTSNLTIYVDGSVRYTKELPIGGELITKDLSYGLKTSFSVAQELKEHHGLSMCSLLNGDSNMNLQFVAVDGRNQREVPKRTLVEIIQSRIEEVFELIQQELQKSNYSEIIPGGIVLTGGCSKLPGIDKAAEEIFGMSVHLGVPIGVDGPQEIVFDPTYSTAIGLLKYKHAGDWTRNHRTVGNGSFMKKVMAWVDEVL